MSDERSIITIGCGINQVRPNETTLCTSAKPGAMSMDAAVNPRGEKAMRPSRLRQGHCSMVMTVVATYVVHSIPVLGISFLQSPIPIIIIFCSANGGVPPYAAHHESIDTNGVRTIEIMNFTL